MISPLRAFLGDRRGNVAFTFVFVLTILLLVAGLAVDYAVAVHRKRSMDAALDVAILAGAKAAADARQGGKENWAAIGEQVMQAMFQVNLPPGSNYEPQSFDARIEFDGAKISSSATYTGRSFTSFMSMFGYDEVKLGSHAAATLTAPNYIDINFVVDISASMGIGAEDSDMEKMVRAIGCEFACHQTPSWEDELNKFVPSKANAAGATLRIDVIRNAITKLIGTIKSQSKGSTIRIGIYTVSRRLNVLQPLSNDLTAVAARANTLTMAQGNDGATFMSYGLEDLAGRLSRGGEGLTAGSPLSFVVLLTDGIDDSMNNELITSGSKKHFYKSVTGKGSDWRTTTPNSAPTNDATLQAFRPLGCSAIKAKKQRMMAVQIKYVSPRAALRDPNFKPKIDYIINKLTTPVRNAFQSCVSNSSSDHVIASTTAQIDVMLNRIFEEAILPDIVHLRQ